MNTDQLLESLHEFPTISDFLHGDIRVPIHAAQIPTRKDRLGMAQDVDGVVIELAKLSSILIGVHYLNLPKVYAGGLRKMFPYIKKHTVLNKCSNEGLQALRQCLGHKLAEVDGGYFLNLVGLPEDLQKPDYRLTKAELYGILAAELLNEVTHNFRVLLKSLPKKDMSRNTVQKQATQSERYHLRWQDIRLILDLMDQAIEKSNVCHFLQVVPMMMRFGQRDNQPLDLSEIVDTSSLTAVTVHLAVKMVSKSADTHILFPRYVLEEQVGVRGSLFSVLGMHETCNFQ